MAKRYYGSIAVSTLLEAAHAKHSAFFRAGKNNRAFVHVNIYINDEPDKFGNTLVIALASEKDKYSQEKKVYIGQMKDSENLKKPNEPNANPVDDLPF